MMPTHSCCVRLTCWELLFCTVKLADEAEICSTHNLALASVMCPALKHALCVSSHPRRETSDSGALGCMSAKEAFRSCKEYARHPRHGHIDMLGK